jgi:hypothetical protein
MRRIAVVVMSLGLITSVTVAAAAAEPGESTPQQVAYGAGSFLGTLLYTPAKATFCVIGAVSSGLALPFGGPPAAGKVASTACGGTWVITPDTIKGKDPVHFAGQ